MPKIYRRNCDNCGKHYSNFNHRFCSEECRFSFGSLKRFYPKDRKNSNLCVKYGNIKARAKLQNWLYPTSKEFVDWYNKQEKKCIYCDIPVEIWELLFKGHQNKYTLSIDRKDNLKGYELDNLALACSQCNIVKNNVLEFEEMKEIGQKYLKPKWQNKLQEVSKNEMVLG